MDNRSKEIEQLARKLNVLIGKQDVLSKEITEIKSVLENLQEEGATSQVAEEVPEVSQPPVEKATEIEKTLEVEKTLDVEEAAVEAGDPGKIQAEATIKTSGDQAKVSEAKPKSGIADIQASQKATRRWGLPESVQSNLEDFIGTNLINKIGILILIIGISIGTKFAIDRDLISPLVRLILGYVLGAGLLFFAYRLKKNYHNFSAVLCSGAMAILYFMTFAGVVFLDLISITPAFIVMVVITVFTVYQALAYDRQVIAILGLVGAYAIPFLIGDDPDAYVFLFSYIAIINAGILVIAIRKYWKLLFYTAFTATWVIYATWWATADFGSLQPFRFSVIISGVYFLLFYASFLIKKVLYKIDFSIEDIILIGANALIFYALGYMSFDIEPWKENISLFTLINASIHALVWLIVFYRSGKDSKLLRLITALVLFFLTIAIPQQYDNTWLPIIWMIEGTLIYVISKRVHANFYTYYAYPVLLIAVFMLIVNWTEVFDNYATVFSGFVTENKANDYTLFFNLNFFSGLVCIAGLALVNFYYYHPKFTRRNEMDVTLWNLASFYITGTLVLITYYTFRIEIAIYFSQLYAGSAATPTNAGSAQDVVLNQDIRNFKEIWLLIYTMVFFAVPTLINILKIKNEILGKFNLLINGLVLFIFLAEGLSILSSLRTNYLSPAYPELFEPGLVNIWIRYLAIILFAGVITLHYRLIRQEFMRSGYKLYVDLFASGAALWILSNELIQWLEIGGYTSTYKLGLSILWGVFSLQLIIIGIWKKIKYLRIAAIALFGITLVKLAAYDVVGMDTLSKTIVFILLGILLLIISFLYNKYREIIF